MSFDIRAFRQALGCFPTGVAVVTVAGVGGAHKGITVNSFTSVSLDPPLVLWCIDRKSDRFDAFTHAKGYTISLLGTAHEEVSARLAKQGAHSLGGIDLIETELGPPALSDALAFSNVKARQCIKAAITQSWLGVCCVFARREAGAPLVFFKGRYGALAS